MYDSGRAADDIVAAEGLAQIGDEGALLGDRPRRDRPRNADAVAQYRAGKQQTFGFLVGQVMKGSGGKANPKLANELLKRELDIGLIGVQLPAADRQPRAILSVATPDVIETHRPLEALQPRRLRAARSVAHRRARASSSSSPGRAAPASPRSFACCCCKERPSEGEILVNGHNLATLSRARGPGIPARHRLRLPGLQADSDAARCSRTSRSCPRCSACPPAQQRRRAFQVLKWVGPAAPHERLSAASSRAASSSASRSPAR